VVQLPHILGGDVNTLYSLLEGLTSECAGICFDTSHANLMREPILQTLERLAPRLKTLHVSDNYGRFDDHFVPGEGTIDWPALSGVLRTAGYDGTFMLELLPGQHHDRLTLLARAYNQAEKIIKPPIIAEQQG
jgi:sugar phosphate isomerase/epimerase